MPRQTNPSKPPAAAKAAPSRVTRKAPPPPSFVKTAASFFKEHVEANLAVSGGTSYVGDQAEKACIGLPLEALSQQFVYSSDVYPLGRMEMCIGESDSCKTAFLFERGRWFLQSQGGFNYQLNEARDPASLRTSIIGRELLKPDGGYTQDGPCKSLEHWQRNVTGIVKRYERTFDSIGGCGFPTMIGLDSITGTTNERAIKKIDDEGCAQLTFGQDANLLNQYAKYLFQRLYPWPLSFVCTNHIKFGTDSYGNKQLKIPGGDELRYVSTYISYLEWTKKAVARADMSGGRNLRLKMMKSMGDHRTIDVQFVWRHDPRTGEQQSFWEWHRATVALLESKQHSTKVREAIADICHIYDSSSGTHAKCAHLGLKKATPIAEVGEAVMHDAKILKALQNMFGIPRRAVFRDGVPYDQQIRDAVASGSVASDNFSDVEGAVKDAELENEDGDDGFVTIPEQQEEGE